MRSVAFESVTEILVLIGSAIGTLLLTVGGAVIEYTALEKALTGHLVMGAWEFWIGTVVLLAGLYLLGYQQLWPRLRGDSLPQ